MKKNGGGGKGVGGAGREDKREEGKEHWTHTVLGSNLYSTTGWLCDLREVT